MGFLADFTVELGAEIKKPYPKLHFCQLFAFLTKKFFLAIFRPLFTARNDKTGQNAISGQ